MPVTAKLSRQFYERLGDEVTNELVEWLDHVDLTYRADLRELNEGNFSRAEAKADQRAAEFDLRLDRRLSEIETKVNQRLADLETKFNQRLTDLETKFNQRLTNFEASVDQRFVHLERKLDRRSAELEAKIESGLERLRGEMVSFKAELIKWMSLFWLGTVATTLAISQALR
jgi:DNA anti-recombination protein RmuC